MLLYYIRSDVLADEKIVRLSEMTELLVSSLLDAQIYTVLLLTFLKPLKEQQRRYVGLRSTPFRSR